MDERTRTQHYPLASNNLDECIGSELPTGHNTKPRKHSGSSNPTKPEGETELEDKFKSSKEGGKRNKFDCMSTDQLNEKLISQQQIFKLQMSTSPSPINKGDNASNNVRYNKNATSTKYNDVSPNEEVGLEVPFMAAQAPLPGNDSHMIISAPRLAADTSGFRGSALPIAAEDDAPSVAAHSDVPLLSLGLVTTLLQSCLTTFLSLW